MASSAATSTVGADLRSGSVLRARLTLPTTSGVLSAELQPGPGAHEEVAHVTSILGTSLCPHQSRRSHGAPSYRNAVWEVPVWHQMGNEPAMPDMAAIKTLTIGSSKYFSHQPQQTVLIQPPQSAWGYTNECVGSG